MSDKALDKMFKDVKPEGDEKRESKTLSSVMSEPKHDDVAEELKECMKDCDVSPDGLPLSRMGKEILRNRLRAAHGPQFESKGSVKNLLSKFDSYLDKYSDVAREKDMAHMASADRTLAMLRKMS